MISHFLLSKHTYCTLQLTVFCISNSFIDREPFFISNLVEGRNKPLLLVVTCDIIAPIDFYRDLRV
jgi:hypothetical protein